MQAECLRWQRLGENVRWLLQCADPLRPNDACLNLVANEMMLQVDVDMLEARGYAVCFADGDGGLAVAVQHGGG